MAKRHQRRGRSGRGRISRASPTDYDSPWKEALDRFFERCMAFFFPHIHADIDLVLELPGPLEERFKEENDALQQEKHMPFMDIYERTGLQRGLLEGIEPLLDVKFGVEGLALMPEIREIRDHVLLRKILKRIRTASSPAEVRRVWTRKPRPKPTERMTENETPPEAATPAPRRSGRRRS